MFTMMRIRHGNVAPHWVGQRKRSLQRRI